MAKKTNEELLASLKKSNKVRRLTLAIRAGFENYKEYRTYLENLIKDSTAVPHAISEKPTIHVVDIVDCSSSMYGSKIEGAVTGVNKGIADLKENKEVDYTYTLCTFSYYLRISFKHFLTPINKVKECNFGASGMTALNDAIGKTLTKLTERILLGEKVLVNIYTDGKENNSEKYNSSEINTLITTLKEKGYTVTFIGTERDTETVINKLNIDKSNTKSYDGTGEGLEKALDETREARVSYSKSVIKGEDVSRGFYKKLN